ncbi:AAA family ATPase [Bacillus sp. ISL-75]|uniref:AAA family ATPase n=1 Tax=Bacillus sp. ISL-75 TaxID=2819137 RepID=UPI001BE8ABCA|nr:AAA family ATPase [Bacillus sp. ISL-75]MBT2727872.1 AAA family ATPase [Bacillus sp. ISL-75]
MTQLTLTRLSLKNFKGVREFTIEMNGQNVRIFGDNATGKTTLFDSFVWLLFDKDSQNKKDFSIKTLVGGKELHNLEHEVEATFDISGITLTLKKVYTEKWTKKRGYPTPEFSGHTTDYFIDGVPSKKKEYTDKVDSIIQEDIFKLLTSPSYFNEQVKWQDRRKTLLEICGDIADEEVIASEKSLAALPSILQGRSIENHRKVIAARRAEINKELDKIPVRIDEIQRTLPNLDGVEKRSLETDIARLNSEIDEKMTLINNIRNGNAISSKQKDIQEIEIAMLQIKQDYQANSNDKVYSLKARIQEENSNATILQSKIDSIKQRKQMNTFNVKDLSENRDRLLKEWHEVNDRVFTHESDCSCPTCGQSLPEEQVQAAKDKTLASFNKTKSDRLESIQKKGKQTKEKLDEVKNANEQLDQEILKIQEQLLEKKEFVGKLKEQLTAIETTIVDILEIPEYAAKLQEKQFLVNEIRELREAADQSIQSIYGEVAELKVKRDQLQGEVGKFAVAEQSQMRIKELEAQQRQLAAEFEKLEGELYLTEEFIRTKVNLLEERINSKFKYAKFKLFAEQINGGLTEVCETLFDGVPYSSGLNNAAKINVGLDIINTLSEHYGFSAPIFVDNAEAVTKLIDTKAQVISLVVSEMDKVLRVEHIDDSLITVDCEVVA